MYEMDVDADLHRNLNIRLQQPRSIVTRIFLAFSIASSFERLVREQSKYPIENLNALRGFKAILTIYYAGSFIFYMTVIPVLNPVSISEESENVWFTIYNSTFSIIDPYLWISGIYTVCILLSELSINRGRWHVFIFGPLTKIVNILPLILCVILNTFFYATIGNGPILSELFFFERHTIRHHWYSYLLFINNLIPMHQQGIIWASFYALDLQLYIAFVPAIALYFYKYCKTSIVLVLLM